MNATGLIAERECSSVRSHGEGASKVDGTTGIKPRYHVAVDQEGELTARRNGDLLDVVELPQARIAFLSSL